MDNLNRYDNDIRKAINAQFSGVVVKPDLQRNVLRQIKGEMIVKKKLSVGFVIAMVLLVLALSALAATILWENYVGGLMQKEQQIGTYAQWGVADKEALVEALVEMGHIEENEKTDKLFDQGTTETEKNELADQIMVAFMEQNANIKDYNTSFNHDVNSINANLLTLAIMGADETWPAEKRVWWQRLTHPDMGSANWMPFVNPDQGDITEKEAIAIGQKAVNQILNVPLEELKNAQVVADMYISDERPEYKRWFISFNILAEGSKTYVERWYEAFVDSGGNLIADPDYNAELLEAEAASLPTNNEDRIYPPILEKYIEYAEYEGSYLVREWSVEGKAEYSAELRPRVQEVLKSGTLEELTNPYARYPQPHQEIIASTTNVYGLPKQEDIPIDEARNLARFYVYHQYGLEEQTNRDIYSYYESYDVTNPDLPLWKFVFYPDSFEGMSDVPVYKVELNAYSGEKVAVERYEWKEIFDGPPFHPIWY